MGCLRFCGVAILLVVTSFVLVHLAVRKEFKVLAPDVTDPKVVEGLSSRGPCVLVTGASTGIGRDAAVDLAARRGFTVFGGVRSDKGRESLLAAVEGADTVIGQVVPIILDVTKAGEIQAAVERVEAELKEGGICSSLAGLVNNAGVSMQMAIELADVEKVRALYDVNVFGLLDMTIAFADLLHAHKGRVVNVGSIAGELSPMYYGPYASSKFAVEALTDSLRGEIEQLGVAVALVQPGAVKTNILQKMQATKRAQMDGLKMTERNQRYAANMLAMDILAATAHFSSTDLTNAAIDHALVSPYPSTRYIVGPDAWGVSLLKHLPDRVRDRIQTFMFDSAAQYDSAEL